MLKVLLRSTQINKCKEEVSCKKGKKDRISTGKERIA